MLSRTAIAVSLAIGLGSVAFGDIVTLDYPGAASTYATSVNNLGQIVGGFLPAGSFLYSGGTFSSLPGGNWVFAINDSGQIVGVSNGAQQIALYDGGVMSYITIPGATYVFPRDINNLGEIAGEYTSGSGATAQNHGFVYSNGIVTTIDGPNPQVSTLILGINDNGQLVGDFGALGPALYSGGVFYPIGFPGAPTGYTSVQSINDLGEIVGYYIDSSNTAHGFADINGVYSSFDAPGATGSYAMGVNNNGDIVGYYADANGVGHGFLDTPVPEPSSIVLLASATGLFAFVRFRRKRRAA